MIEFKYNTHFYHKFRLLKNFIPQTMKNFVIYIFLLFLNFVLII